MEKGYNSEMFLDGSLLLMITYLWWKFSPETIGTLRMLAMGGLGIYSLAKYLFRSRLNIFCEWAGLAEEGKSPGVKTTKTDYGMEYKVRMLPGQSLTDYMKKQEALNQYLKAETEMEFADDLIIRVKTAELLKSYDYVFEENEKPLNVLLGMSRMGPYYLDIESCPHLLVAGETGGGKSVLLRNIITSLILNGKCTLHLIDKQRVELGIFKHSDRVKSFVSEDYDIMRLLAEMEQIAEERLTELENNNLVRVGKDVERHVVIIDELAGIKDKVIKSEIERRVAQDRKVGIHYILSTQRPSVDVINGVIKANLPSRIAFKTVTAIDSRVILDQDGAETLSAKGRMIVKKDGKTEEVQGMYLSEEEAQKLIAHTHKAKLPVKKNKENVHTEYEEAGVIGYVD